MVLFYLLFRFDFFLVMACILSIQFSFIKALQCKNYSMVYEKWGSAAVMSKYLDKKFAYLSS